MLLQPAIIFAGELFEKEEALGHAKGLLLDFFRGRQVNNIALKVCACPTRLQCSELAAGFGLLSCARLLPGLQIVMRDPVTVRMKTYHAFRRSHSAEAEIFSCCAAGCGQGHVRQCSRCVHTAGPAVPHPPQKDRHQGKHCNVTLISAL